MTQPQRYRKRPVEVEAVLFDGSLDSATAVIDWVLANGGTARAHDIYDVNYGVGAPIYLVGGIHIDTLEGVMNASEGDYVIKGVAGEFYPVKGTIFAETYELVETTDEVHDGVVEEENPR